MSGGLERAGGEKYPEDREMRRRSLQAIREGRALPTPNFAVEEGQEMVTILTHELERLNAEQLDALLENLNHVKTLKAVEATSALRDKMDVFTAKGILVPAVIGWLLGTTLSGTPEGGVAVMGAVTVGKKTIDNLKAHRQIGKVNAKIELVTSLIEKVKAKKTEKE